MVGYNRTPGRGISARRLICMMVITALLTASHQVGVFAGQPSSDREQRMSEVAKELESLRLQLSDVDAEEAKLIAELRVSTTRQRKLEATLSALDARAQAARVDLDVAQSAYEEADGRYQLAYRRAKSMQERLLAAKSILEDQAITAFIHYGAESGRQLQRVLETSSWRELHEVNAYLDVVAEEQQKVIEVYKDLRRQSADAERQEKVERDAARQLRDDVARMADAIEGVRSEQLRSYEAAQSETEEQRRLIAILRERQAGFEARMVALKRESAAISDLLRRRQVGQQPVASGIGVVSWPLKDVRITSEFGMRIHPIYGTERMHDGIDLASAQGVAILASADGVVAAAGERGGYGNTVVLDHGQSLSTLYAHQSSIAVSVGDTVKRGQVIGLVGSTGMSTGPHLHFEVRIAGSPVDPMQYL